MTADNGRLDRPTLPEAVLQELRINLIQGRYGPGDPIRVDQVASELGVSAIPVREALRVLLAEGMVEYAPHRGYRVTTLSFDDVEEIFLICRLLESEALRRGVPRMDAAGVERMEQLLDRLEEPDAGDVLWDKVAAHQDFHFVPIQYAQLPRLEAELRRMWDHTDHYRSLFCFSHDDWYSMMSAEHRAIAAACAERDGERVVELFDAHRKHALARVREGIGHE